MNETAIKKVTEPNAAGAKTFDSAPEYGEAPTFRGLSTPNWRQGVEGLTDFSQSMQRPELVMALKFSRDPARTMEKWNLQSLLADETKLPASVINGPIFDRVKSAMATRYSDSGVGSAISNSELARRVELDRGTNAMQEAKDPMFLTKPELYQRAYMAAPRGFEHVYLVLAAAQLASTPTLDDPIVVAPVKGVDGPKKTTFRVWDNEAPSGYRMFADYEYAWMHMQKVWDRLEGVKPKERQPAAHYEWPSSPGPKGEFVEAKRGIGELGIPVEGGGMEPGYGGLIQDAMKAVGGALDTAGEVAVDAGHRAGRGWENGQLNVKTSIDLWLRELGRSHANPYVFKTVEEAKTDLRRLDGEIVAIEDGIERERKRQGGGYAAGSRHRDLDELRKQRELAYQASRGLATDTFLGSLYHAAKEQLDQNREAREEVRQRYAGRINPEYDDWITMQAVEGLSGNTMSLAATYALPLLGMGVSYMNSQGVAHEEFYRNAAELGLNASEEAALAYSIKQGAAGAVIDTVGNMAQMGMVGKLAGSGGLLQKGAAFGIGTMVDLGAGAGQTVLDQRIAEAEGLRDKMTAEEMTGALVNNLKVDAASSALLGLGGKLAGDIRSSLPEAGSSQRGNRAERDGEVPFDPSEKAGVRFSKKGTRPHRLAKPIELNYRTYDERLKDPAYVLEDILRGNRSSNEGKQGKYGRELASASGLHAWADVQGRKFDPEFFAFPVSGGGEHLTFVDKRTGRIFKLTKPGLFGAQAEDAGAYLERQALSNRVLGDDVRVEGIVTLPGEDEPRLVTSQSIVRGRDASSAEQGEYLRSKGFVEHEGRWVHPILEVAVWDTVTPGNVIRRPDGSMQAVDLQIEAARAEELRAVRQRTGLGGETFFSKGSEKHIAGPEHARQVRSWTEEIRDGWGSQLEVVVHDSAEGVADARLREEVLKEGGGVEAFFDPADGRIHLLADRVGSKADAERLMRHEGIHWAVNGGLKGEYESILEGVRKRISGDEWKELKKSYSQASDQVLVEEYLAYLGQNNPKAGAWQSFVYEFKQAMKRVFGRDFEVTDADVLAFLAKANRELERGDRSGVRVYSEADLLFAKGSERKSWEEVKVGDDFNAVKKHLPYNSDKPEMLDLRGEPGEIYGRVAEMLRQRPFVIDPDGRKILVGNPDGRADDDLLTRAEHLTASKTDTYKRGDRSFRDDKARWVPNIWKTVEDYGAIIRQFNDSAYVRKYGDGAVHVVFVEGQKVVGYETYEAAVVSQRALKAHKSLKGAAIVRKKPPGAFPIQGEP